MSRGATGNVVTGGVDVRTFCNDVVTGNSRCCAGDYILETILDFRRILFLVPVAERSSGAMKFEVAAEAHLLERISIFTITLTKLCPRFATINGQCGKFLACSLSTSSQLSNFPTYYRTENTAHGPYIQDNKIQI